MELIVAVYDDWGIGCCGTQPIALSADRKFFREMTRGAMVIVGRRTIADFPGQKPLPGRVNVALTRSTVEIPGFTVCHSPEAAVELAKTAQESIIPCFIPKTAIIAEIVYPIVKPLYIIAKYIKIPPIIVHPKNHTISIRLTFSFMHNIKSSILSILSVFFILFIKLVIYIFNSSF